LSNEILNRVACELADAIGALLEVIPPSTRADRCCHGLFHHVADRHSGRIVRRLQFRVPQSVCRHFSIPKRPGGHPALSTVLLDVSGQLHRKEHRVIQFNRRTAGGATRGIGHRGFWGESSNLILDVHQQSLERQEVHAAGGNFRNRFAVEPSVVSPK